MKRAYDTQKTYGFRVTLILNGLNIASDTGRTLEIASGKEVTIQLSEGTENVISALSEGEEAASAIYSKADLVLTGPGALKAVSAGKHGVQSTDGITVQSGDLTIIAANCGLRAQDFIRVNGGSLRLFTGGDALHASGSDNNPELGQIEITGGTILAIGVSGMAEAFENTSSQCSFLYNELRFYARDILRGRTRTGTCFLNIRPPKRALPSCFLLRRSPWATACPCGSWRSF